MTTTAGEAFAKRTGPFNAHDIDEFAGILAGDGVFHAPGGMNGEGKDACGRYYAGWLSGTAFG
jgi:SnoaL-like domain